MSLQIQEDINNTLYKKVGRRYVPATDPWATTGLSEGAYIVIVRPSHMTIRQAVWPDKGAIEAALHELEDELMDILREASQAEPPVRHLSKEQKVAWGKLMRAKGESFSTYILPSQQKIVDAILARVRGKVQVQEQACRE